MKKAFFLFITLCLILSLFTGCSDKTPNVPDGIAVPTAIKDVEKNSFKVFTTVDLDGNVYDASVFKDKKVTMINIWGTFCSPCISEMPALQRLSEEYKDKDFQIIGIVSDVHYSGGYYSKSKIDSAKAVLANTAVTYLNLLPSYSLDKIKLNEVYSIPETFFVDSEGNIISESYVGSRSYDSWKQIIDGTLMRVS